MEENWDTDVLNNNPETMVQLHNTFPVNNIDELDFLTVEQLSVQPINDEADDGETITISELSSDLERPVGLLR